MIQLPSPFKSSKQSKKFIKVHHFVSRFCLRICLEIWFEIKSEFKIQFTLPSGFLNQIWIASESASKSIWRSTFLPFDSESWIAAISELAPAHLFAYLSTRVCVSLFSLSDRFFDRFIRSTCRLSWLNRHLRNLPIISAIHRHRRFIDFRFHSPSAIHFGKWKDGQKPPASY